MVHKPIIPTARVPGCTARARRAIDWATTKPNTSDVTMFVDLPAITPVPGTTIDDPTAVGQTWWGGINTTLGGNWSVTGTGIGTVTFTGAGSWALLKAHLDNDVLQWALVASNGVS